MHAHRTTVDGDRRAQVRDEPSRAEPAEPVVGWLHIDPLIKSACAVHLADVRRRNVALVLVVIAAVTALAECRSAAGYDLASRSLIPSTRAIVSAVSSGIGTRPDI